VARAEPRIPLPGVELSRSRADQVAPRTVGLGPLTDTFYYGLGVGVTNE
jgi:hypothetical protein